MIDEQSLANGHDYASDRSAIGGWHSACKEASLVLRGLPPITSCILFSLVFNVGLHYNLVTLVMRQKPGTADNHTLTKYSFRCRVTYRNVHLPYRNHIYIKNHLRKNFGLQTVTFAHSAMPEQIGRLHHRCPFNM